VNLYNNPEVIHYTLGHPRLLHRPLVRHPDRRLHLIRKQVVKVADLYTMSPKGAYWYRNGYNRKAIWPWCLRR